MARKIYILEKRRLERRHEKATHIREMHTFECNVCEFRSNNKEELDIHILTCEMYFCSLCGYKHKRLSEMKTHCKTKHTRNTIIKHCKMDRNNFSKLSCTNYFSEEV